MFNLCNYLTVLTLICLALGCMIVYDFHEVSGKNFGLIKTNCTIINEYQIAFYNNHFNPKGDIITYNPLEWIPDKGDSFQCYWNVCKVGIFLRFKKVNKNWSVSYNCYHRYQGKEIYYDKKKYPSKISWFFIVCLSVTFGVLLILSIAEIFCIPRREYTNLN